MKRLLTVTAFVLGLVLIAPAWSHHFAQGIISDEIWDMINQNLIDADSPHLTVDPGVWMDSLGSMTDPETGRASLVSSIEVLEEDLATYENALLDAMVAVENRVPSGETSSETASILTYGIDPDPDEEGVFVISIFEPIGGGQSQDPDRDQGQGDDQGERDDQGQDEAPVITAPRKRR